MRPGNRLAVVQWADPAAIVWSQWLTGRRRADSSEFADRSAFLLEL